MIANIFVNLSAAKSVIKIFMNSQAIARLFLCVVLLMQANIAFAFETDQYNLPPEPLADIGDEVSEYAEQNLRNAGDFNRTARNNCLGKFCGANC